MKNFANPKQTAKDRENAREIILSDMLAWYLQESPPGVVPVLCVDKKGYSGMVLRWFEPIIPGIDNPVLVERFEGDSWTLKLDRMAQKITNLRPR